MSKEEISITGEGSIREVKKGRVYQIRHRLPPAYEGGPRKWSPTRTVYGNKAAARRALEDYREELEAKLNGEVRDVTVAEYARLFHEHRKDAKLVAEQTLDRERFEIERIERLFPKLDLAQITLADVNGAYDKLRREGMSQSGINIFHAKLSQVLEKAYREEYLTRNPCKLVESAEVKRPKSENRVSLTSEQFARLGHDLMDGERDGKIVAVWIAMAVGGRKGEILGLQWRDVDFEEKKISFVRQLTSKGKLSSDLKTKGSTRTRAIDDSTVNFLENWWYDQSELFYGGGAVPEDAPICCNDLGGLMSTSAFDKWRRCFFAEHGLGRFKVVEERRDRNGHKRYHYSGYEGLCLHELRHTQATLLLADGVDIKTVQERGGWASAQVPMEIYAHVLAESERSAADTIGKRMPSVVPTRSRRGLEGRFRRPGDGVNECILQGASPKDIKVEKHRHRCPPMARGEAQEKILNCFEGCPADMLLSKKEISEQCGITSEKVLAKTLQALQAEGKLLKTGNTKASRYQRLK